MTRSHQQSSRQIQECLTSQSVAEVLKSAEWFFASGGGIYTAFIEKRSPTHINLRGQGNEEIVIAVRATDEGTWVSGSTYFYDQQVARFLQSLPPVTTPPMATAGAALSPGSGEPGSAESAESSKAAS